MYNNLIYIFVLGKLVQCIKSNVKRGYVIRNKQECFKIMLIYFDWNVVFDFKAMLNHKQNKKMQLTIIYFITLKCLYIYWLVTLCSFIMIQVGRWYLNKLLFL